MQNRIMPFMSNRLLALGGTLIVFVLVLNILWQPSASDTPEQPLAPKEEKKESTPATDNTLASAWQWNTQPAHASQEINAGDRATPPAYSKENAMPSETVARPFTEESVYTALQSIRLDDQQNIILDHEALLALNEALDYQDIELNTPQMAELQDLIRAGLPGSIGEQTAQIVADYHDYLVASREFNAIYESSMSTENAAERYAELASLRALYLGQDVADKLFRVSDANAQYMLDMAQIDQDSSLSEEEKQQQRDQVIERHVQTVIDIPDWANRHAAFSQEKDMILSSGVSEQEQKQQLTQLLHRHFNPSEIAQIEHLQLDSP